MPSDDLLLRAAHAWDDYQALANTVHDEAGLRIVCQEQAPDVYDANYASRVRASTPDEIDALLVRVEWAMSGLGHRRFVCDPLTPEAFEARLQLDDYKLGTELELLLEGELRGPVPDHEIREVLDDADWAAMAELFELDLAEDARREARERYSPAVDAAMLAQRRAKAPAVRTWLARVGDVDCGFFSSWPGHQGVGKVEDLFTREDFRGRGVATALIHHAVRDARARGAGPVMIGARPEDTPKRMYAALGFRPAWVQRGWLRRVAVPS